MSEGSNFSKNIRQWVEKTKSNGDKFVRNFCQDLFNEVIVKTPVDTGFARNHWFTSVNTATLGDSSNSQAQAVQALAGVKIGDVIYLSNNAAYIRRLEYGWSQQAPNGMVRVALSRADVIAQDALRRMNNG